jgi:hypothetical protein
MDELDHADTDEQTPGEQIEHRVAQTREQPIQAERPSQSEPEQVVPETQAVDPQSSSTLSAETNATPAEALRAA